MKVTTGFTHIFIFSCSSVRGGSWAAATSKMERFVIIEGLGCCKSPRSASECFNRDCRDYRDFYDLPIL